MTGIVPLLQHHYARAIAGVAYQGLINCHAYGLDSIMLHDTPGNRIRMFAASACHTLWRNQMPHPFSIAIHPHHCAIRFIGLYGPVHNDVYALTPNPRGSFAEMNYQSAITADTGSLTPTGRHVDVHCLRSEPMSGHPMLQAHELHTVHVRQFEPAAWLVLEGMADPDYQSHCWTNSEPDFTDLYQPMPNDHVADILGEVIKQVIATNKQEF